METTANNSSSDQEPVFLTGDDLPDPLITGVLDTICLPDDPYLAVEIPDLIRGTLGSLSLSLAQKTRVFNEIPTLSRFQVEALQDVFADEQKEFVNLFRQENEQDTILTLSAKSIIRAFSLAILRGQGYPDPKEETRVIGEMSVDKAARVPGLTDFLQKYDQTRSGNWDVAVRFVYGSAYLPALSEERSPARGTKEKGLATKAILAFAF